MSGPAAAGGEADPFAVLGLDRSATLDDVRSARRRLAFDLHPDRGGDEHAMRAVNGAFEACVAHLTGRRVLPPPGGPATPAPTAPGSRIRREPPPVPWGQRRRRPQVEYDAPSFTVDALPAETFEALLVVAGWIGDVLDDDPPYVLECHLHEPAPCWCRLDLVPDAGGSTVSLTVASPAGERGGVNDLTFVERVRDVWVEQLNRLGRPQP
ncbi:MAG: J domain-containing protein [Ilumatobacteraceae bacterium]|nr:J domain-containing protein [Acidimicrobiales bacterium]MCB9395477.1 J domain-containing protein [Acidimicrobiaceae bacterium]